MKSFNNARFLLTIAAVCIAITACTAIPPRQPVELTMQVNTIAVLPVETPLQINPVNGNGVSRDQLEAGAVVLDTLLADYFKDRPGAMFVSHDQMEGVAAAAIGSRQMLARQIGKKLKVDAILVSIIHRYRLRDGSEYSVDQPASVAFELQLLSVASGQVLCALVFDETQQTLFENIFSFSRAASRKFRWVTAEELAAEGLQQKLDSCVYLNPPPPATP